MVCDSGAYSDYRRKSREITIRSKSCKIICHYTFPKLGYFDSLEQNRIVNDSVLCPDVLVYGTTLLYKRCLDTSSRTV